MSDVTPKARMAHLRPVTATAASTLIVLVALVAPIADRGWFGGFRLFLYPDQLSYAAISSNIAAGDLGLVEPFTRTGNLFYAAGWYQLIGLVSLVTHLPVHLVWTLLGLLIVGTAVAIAGWTSYRVSRRGYAPLLPAAGVLTGTLATALTGNWFLSLDSHAVLWGPISTLFTLNGEVAGLCIVAVSLNAVHLRADVPRYRALVLIAASFAVGLTSMVHTYAFIAGTLLAVTLAAAWGLLRTRSSRRFAVTVGLVAVILILGPWLAGVVGPLALFGLLLLCFLPAVIPAIRVSRWLAAGVVLAYLIAAAPQVIRIAAGYISDDSFLVYRALSTTSLGVPVLGGTAAAAVFVLAAATCVITLAGSGQTFRQALLASLIISAALLSQNDRWGFNQEPYRFWVAFTVVFALVLSPLLAWSLANLSTSCAPRTGRVLAIVLAGAWVLSLPDVVGSSAYARAQGTLPVDDSRAQALRGVVATADGLVLSSRCLPPSWLANVTDADVAYYNRGLAWPANATGLAPFLDPVGRAGDDPAKRAAGGIAYVLTDSTCADDWRVDQADGEPVARATYALAGEQAELVLWRIIHTGS